MRLFVMFLFLSALPVSAQEAPPPGDEITVTDINPLPAPKPHTFGLRIAFGGISRQVCDPFGHRSAECAHSKSPAGTISLGDTWWSVAVSGSHSTGAVRGTGGRAVVNAHGGAFGPVRIGISLESQVESWHRTVYRFEDTTLGTTRNLEAGFAGLHVGAGGYHGPHVRLVILGGYWRSMYRGTLAVPGFNGNETLAQDEFVLGRVRLEAGNLRIGKRARISGTVQRSWAFLTPEHPSVSPAIPPTQWSGTADASVRAWSPTPRTHLEVVLSSRVATGKEPMLDDTAFGLSIAWHFR